MLLFLVLFTGLRVHGGVPHAPSALKINGMNCVSVAHSNHKPRIEVITQDNSLSSSIVLDWEVSHTDRNVQYSGHHIMIQTANTDETLIYSSEKKIVSGDSHHMVDPADLALDPWKNYFFKVKWFDGQNTSSTWSEACHFTTVSSSYRDWSRAKYISAPTSIHSAPMIMKTFELTGKEKVEHAILGLVGLGFFRVFVNGHDILSESKPPIKHVGGWTNTESRVPYVALDVTHILSTSRTVSLAIVLGDGYRDTKSFKPKAGRSKSDSVNRVARVNFEITFSNGGVQSVYSDGKDGWTVMATPITADSIYDGETFDARMDTAGIWSAVEPRHRHSRILQALTAATPVVEVTGPPGALFPSVQPFVSEMETIKAVKIWSTISGSQVVDFGENSAGLVKISTKGLVKGHEIKMHHAEVKQHPPYGSVDGSLYYANLRSAMAMDTFVSDGNTSEYTPSFTIHGFQFVEVMNYPRTIGVADIVKTRIFANLRRTSFFESSSPALNGINANCIRAQESNLQSVPTDCPQRDERLGWMGDAGLSVDSMTINFDVESFLSNFLNLIRDDQDANGDVPEVVPWYRYGNRPSDPAWGWAFTHISTVLRKVYPSLGTPKTLYPQILKYVERVVTRFRSAGGCAKFRCSYGDWCPPPPNARVNAAWVAGFASLQSLSDVIALATSMNKSADVSKLMAYRKEIAHNCTAAFWDDKSKTFGDRNQSSYAMALAANILSSSDELALESNLLSLITNTNTNHITTGIIGAKFLLPVLSAANSMALALDMVTGQNDAVYPSWGFMKNNTVEPATGVWELWNSLDAGPGMNSRNHHMFSSVSQFIHEHVGGIEFLSGNVVVLRPGHVGRKKMGWVKTRVRNVGMEWEWVGGNMVVVVVEIPVGKTGRLIVPSVGKVPCRKVVVEGVAVTPSVEMGNVRSVPLGNGRTNVKIVC